MDLGMVSWWADLGMDPGADLDVMEPGLTMAAVLKAQAVFV